jgi:hypothetical protein
MKSKINLVFLFPFLRQKLYLCKPSKKGAFIYYFGEIAQMVRAHDS